MLKRIIPVLLAFFPLCSWAEDYDIIIYGSTGAGVSAAVQAARMGGHVLLLSPSEHIGGVAASGLGATDINVREAIGGISREFYKRIYKYYLSPEAWKEGYCWTSYSEELGNRFWKGRDTILEMQWMFEPHVAEQIYSDMLFESGVDIILGERLCEKNGVYLQDGLIRYVRTESGNEYKAKMFIDASYEGDLMAMAGIDYHVGRENNGTYGETMNGYLPNGMLHKSESRVDPYILEGDPESGLLPFIDDARIVAKGEGDNRIQAYCYRFTLTDDPCNKLEIKKPDRYEPLWYEHIVRWLEVNPRAGLDDVLTLTPLPNGKTDTNHADFVGANYGYPEGTYSTRDSIARMHRDYTEGLLWCLANDIRVPEHVRNDMQKWGFSADEFIDNDNFPYQLYVREARRMIGDYVMTEADVTGQKTAPKSIGLGTYWFDSHVVSRFANHMTGSIHDEGSFWADESVYPIGYGAICPKRRQCGNLLVPVCLSASHAAYGSIRMEPVYMVLGQSAAIAAVLSIKNGCAVQDLDYDSLLASLLEYGQIVFPEDSEKHFPFDVSGAIQSNMVVQQGKEFTVWGRGPCGAHVRVECSWCDTPVTAIIGPDGEWSCSVHVPKADPKRIVPQSIDVSCGRNSVHYDNILIGEVWLLSGQSNMEMTMQPSEPWHHGVENWKEEVSKANEPLLRFITSDRVQSDMPSFAATGKWMVCSPETAGLLSGVGYYFARRLIDELDIPVGLVITSHGSMSAQMYTPNKTIASVPALYSKYLKPCMETPEKILETNRTEKLFNGMIYPYRNLSIRGFLWYQGESNAGEYDTYHVLVSKMAESWRNLFGQGDLPFYYVQVSPYSWREEGDSGPSDDDFYNDSYAYFRESQSFIRDMISHSDMVVTMDVGEVKMAHYPKKKPVGERLAAIALANDYGKIVACYSPRYSTFSASPGMVTVSFDNTYGGLQTSDGQPPKHFYVAGPDRQFREAYAEIYGDKVRLYCPDIAEPVAVRYAFLDFPVTNLENSAHFPVEPFRTDDWLPETVSYRKKRLNTGLFEPQDPHTLPGKTTLISSGDMMCHLIDGWKMASANYVDAQLGNIHDLAYDTSGWYDATVPGTVLTTLVDNGIYPDPYFGINNLSIPDSLCRTSWWFRCIFELPEDCERMMSGLLFEGINYKADIWLNGNMVGTISGAFCRGDFDITDYMKKNGRNVLAVKIYPPDHPGVPHEQSIAAGMGPNGGQLCLDGPTFISSEGWDWVPGIRDRNIGIWQDVVIYFTEGMALKDYKIVTDLPLPDNDRADINFSTEVFNYSDTGCEAEVKFEFDCVAVSKKVFVEGGSLTEVTFSPSEFPALRLRNPKLWWPNGYGQPYMYDATVTVYVNGKESDSRHIRFGIRELSYDFTVYTCDGEFADINFNPIAAYPVETPVFDIQNNVKYKDENVFVPHMLVNVGSPGITLQENTCSPYLVIRVNGKRIFIRGGNWGMDDAMKRVSRERLEPYIKMHKEQGLNMIRNWTGESTEDIFFTLCDEYGILVFNDFPMSTMDYNLAPLDNELMLHNIEEIVKRYRNHPSIAVWCPRNEGYAPVQLEPEIINIISGIDGTRHYSGTSIHVNLTGSGPWGLRQHEDNFGKDIARGFSTELGTISIPTEETIRKFIPKQELWPISDTWAYHDLHHGGWLSFDKITGILDCMYGKSSNVTDFCRRAQMYNYDAYRSMFEGFNSRMWDNTSGLLLWMSHPAWPSVLWQTYSYDYETPAAYFGVKKSCEILHVQYNPLSRYVQVVNNCLDDKDVIVSSTLFDLYGKKLDKNVWKGCLEGSSVQNCFDPGIPNESLQPVMLRLQVKDCASGEKYVNEYWIPSSVTGFEAFMDIKTPELEMRNVKSASDGDLFKMKIKNTGETPALYIKFNVRNGKGNALLPAFFSDGYFTLFPGESRQVSVDMSFIREQGPRYLTVCTHCADRLSLGIVSHY